MAAVFMPIVPALITGGMILAFKNLLVNYFGVAMDSGTAVILTSIFSAAFTFLPVYIGFTMAKRLKMEPIMGAFLGGLLVSSNISGAAGLSFLGIGIPVVEYTGSVLPIMLGIGFMYFVDKLFQKYIPETVRYFLKPLCTMIVVVPVTLIILGPIGTILSTYVGVGITNLMNAIGGIAMPIFAVVYPYMVMLGLDKAIMPIGFNSVATIGYDPAIMVMGFISNLCIGGSALAVATTIRNDKSKKRYDCIFWYYCTLRSYGTGILWIINHEAKSFDWYCNRSGERWFSCWYLWIKELCYGRLPRIINCFVLC